MSADLSRQAGVWAMIRQEITRQTEIHGPDAVGAPDVNGDRRMTILTEEIGEVAREVLDDNGMHALHCELIQVAACAVAWLEAITCYCGGYPLEGQLLRVRRDGYTDTHGRTACHWNTTGGPHG